MMGFIERDYIWWECVGYINALFLRHPFGGAAAAAAATAEDKPLWITIVKAMRFFASIET